MAQTRRVPEQSAFAGIKVKDVNAIVKEMKMPKASPKLQRRKLK